MSANATIMIVDDAEDSRVLQCMLLEDKYTVVEALSGEDCIKQVEQSVPNLILLDINMTGMNGYEVCVHLRKQVKTATLPIIFVSGMFKPEERLQGYEAGANDYVTKPIDGEDLLKRVADQLVCQLNLSNSQVEAKNSMTLALEAMTYSGEMGQLMEFVKKSQAVDSMRALADMVCETITDFSISASAYIADTGEGDIFSGCDVDSVEAELLRKSWSSKKNIVHAGIRTIVKSEQICLLIKNMPVDDENRYGRIKDHLSVLVNICDGPILTLQARQDLAVQRKKVLEKVILVTEERLEEFNVKLSAHDNSIYQILTEMVTQLETMLFGLGLDEDQEKLLMGLAYNASEKLNETRKSTQQLEGDLSIILEGLYEILNSSTYE
jgi:CheY-like chemotaxis protein